MNKIYKYKDIIIIEDSSVSSGYKRPIDAKTMKFFKAGTASAYEKFKDKWKEIGTLGETHFIKDGVLVCNKKSSNRSVSFPAELLDKLDELAKEQERPFSWIVQKLILKGLNNE